MNDDDHARTLPRSADRPSGTDGKVLVLAFRLPAWLPWMAAGGFALLAGFLSQTYFAARSEMVALREHGALAEIESKSLQQQIETERILGGLARFKIVPLAMPPGLDPPAQALALWDPHRQEGELAIFKLPPLASDKDYQLWIVDPQDPLPVSGGIFAIEPDTRETRIRFKPDRPVTNAARFDVSVERKGGVPRAEGPIVLSSQ